MHYSKIWCRYLNAIIMGTGEAKAGSKSDNVTEITFEYSFFSAEIKK